MAGSQAMDTAHLERLAKVLEINSNETIKPPRSEESKVREEGRWGGGAGLDQVASYYH